VARRKQQLITASEIARYLFCARALAFDYAHPEESSPTLFVRLRHLLGSIWFLLILALLVLHLFLVADPLQTLITFGGGLLVFVGIRFLWRRMRRANNISYQGVQAVRNRRTLVSEEIGLSGKPDYLLEMNGGQVPVLTKNNPAPDFPHEAHVLQVIAYCLLIAEGSKKRPRFGVIRYGDGRTFEVDFDEESVEMLSRAMDNLDKARQQETVHRNHQDRARCYACNHRHRCDESLFP
jgi:CRISPR-associated exonuclease Cas4